MEAFGSHYAVIINSPELRRAFLDEDGAAHMPSRVTRQHWLRSRLSAWVKALRGAIVTAIGSVCDLARTPRAEAPRQLRASGSPESMT